MARSRRGNRNVNTSASEDRRDEYDESPHKFVAPKTYADVWAQFVQKHGNDVYTRDLHRKWRNIVSGPHGISTP